MVKVLAMILFAVELGAGFGTASAELVSTSGNAIEVDIRVEVVSSAESVIAHLVFEDEPEILLPLLQREPGVFGIRTEVKAVNYRVLFELLGPEPEQSEPYSLMELGLEESVTGTTAAAAPSEEEIDAASNWLWLALAFGAAALSALAFWVLGGEDQSSSESDSTEGDTDGDVLA